MEIGSVFKNNIGTYDVVVGFEKKGNRSKIKKQRFGEYALKKTLVNLNNMSASQALERIMDICGIDQDGKFQIRAKFNLFSRPTRGNSK